VVHVTAANQMTDELVSAVHRLLPQLSSSAPALSDAEIEEIVTSPATTLLVARDDEIEGEEVPARASAGDGGRGPIVGMLTLVVFRIPTGVRAWIEDVVVDSSAGRRGAGEALTRAAIELAGELGAQTVDLTSRPSREAANRLYQKVGFEARQTNVYRFKSGA
jgi:ribosomal protein S18 acetylase RimI-like enzyme